MNVLGKLVPDYKQTSSLQVLFILHFSITPFSIATNIYNTTTMTIIEGALCISVIFIFNMLSNTFFA